MGIILFIVSILLFIPLTLINLTIVMVKHRTWRAFDGYFFQTAIDIDRFGNRNFRTLFNATLIEDWGYQFGDARETISSVLGKNQRDNSLTVLGEIVVFILDKIDKDHCKKSIKELDNFN